MHSHLHLHGTLHHKALQPEKTYWWCIQHRWSTWWRKPSTVTWLESLGVLTSTSSTRTSAVCLWWPTTQMASALVWWWICKWRWGGDLLMSFFVSFFFPFVIQSLIDWNSTVKNFLSLSFLTQATITLVHHGPDKLKDGMKRCWILTWHAYTSNCP